MRILNANEVFQTLLGNEGTLSDMYKLLFLQNKKEDAALNENGYNSGELPFFHDY